MFPSFIHAVAHIANLTSFNCQIICHWDFPRGSWVKNLLANAGDAGSTPELGRSPEGGHGYPLHYSCLGNAMDRGAWQATVREVTKSRTQRD